MNTILKISAFLFFTIFICQCQPEKANEQPMSASTYEHLKQAYAIAIHGGAGVIKKENMTAKKEASYLAALNKALATGETILKNGGTAMDAVEQTIIVLEDSPLFNAGKGAVFTNAGTNELDASFMDGATQNAGAVGGVTIVKNPIQAARLVMEASPHVMLTGEGANTFAQKNGLDTVSNAYFFTQSRYDALQKALSKENRQMGVSETPIDWKYGTVGCVALDKNGNLAGGTSTGGMTNKKYGRIGDSPIIAAGTYADNATCAISCTGHGEFFIRYVVAYDIAARMAYLKEDLTTASNYVVNKKLVEKGGSGGLIALDKYGNVSMPFNTAGMFRGFAKADGTREVAIYGKE